VETTPVTALEIGAKSAEILLRETPFDISDGRGIILPPKEHPDAPIRVHRRCADDEAEKECGEPSWIPEGCRDGGRRRSGTRYLCPDP
jgi:hypothetical protein